MRASWPRARTGESLGIVGDGVRQPLDCHFAIQGYIARAVDLAHAAFADQRYDDVRPMRVPGASGI